MTYTTQAEVRAAFWASHPHLRRKPSGRLYRMPRPTEYPTDTRAQFCYYVERLLHKNQISADLARVVVL